MDNSVKVPKRKLRCGTGPAKYRNDLFAQRTDCCNGRVLSYLSIPLLFAVSTTPTSSTPPVRSAAASGLRPSVTACAVVTKADVVQALGFAIEKGEEEKQEAASTCSYSKQDGMVSVTVQRLQKKLNLEVEIAALKASIPDSAVREASGLGGRAFFLDISGAGTQLYVIHGDCDFLVVSVLGFGEAARVSSIAEVLARKALARL